MWELARSDNYTIMQNLPRGTTTHQSVHTTVLGMQISGIASITTTDTLMLSVMVDVDLFHATSVLCPVQSSLIIGFDVIESWWLHWRKEKRLRHFASVITSVNILLFAHHAQHHSKMHLLIQTSANTDIENKSWFCQLLTDIYLVSAVVSVIFTGWMDIFIWLSKE